jgi:hypothetical protein
MTTPKQAAADLDPGIVFLVACVLAAVTLAIVFGGLS